MRIAGCCFVLWMLVPAAAAREGTAMSPEECRVFERELSFADAVARHDASAFAEHLHGDAAFGVSRASPTRGREAITRKWADIVSGRAGRLEWYPTRATIAGQPDVAWSSGPSLFETHGPDGRVEYALGTFQSVWARGADGVWRVLFDDGTAPRAASAAEAAAFRAARPASCVAANPG